MSGNPYPKYIDTEGMRRGAAHRAWNEGYNAALDAVLAALKARSLGQTAAGCVRALRKEVSP